MKSPKEKYENDPDYRKVVDILESLVHDGKFTPSEIREMATLASIHNEMRYGFQHYAQTVNVQVAFKILEEWKVENYKKAQDRQAREEAKAKAKDKK